MRMWALRVPLDDIFWGHVSVEGFIFSSFVFWSTIVSSAIAWNPSYADAPSKTSVFYLADEQALGQACLGEPCLNKVSKTAIHTHVLAYSQRPKIAIIIDDLGYQLAQSEQLLSIHHPMTFAIIPDSPYASVIADDVIEQSQELMLHIPMETVAQIAWEDGLTMGMNLTRFSHKLATIFEQFPKAQGVNNHGGSLLTQSHEKMQWLMRDLSTRGLYFVDSRTTAATVAQWEAQRESVKNIARDVFLDNHRDVHAISIQFEKLKKIALKQGHAVGIGHPHPETIAFLRAELGKHEMKVFDLVHVSQLLSPVK